MSEAIQPALTPEEWEKWYPYDELRVVCAGYFLEEGRPPRFAAVAALVLHGQPFGFTHEDVEMAQMAAMLGRRSRMQMTNFGERLRPGCLHPDNNYEHTKIGASAAVERRPTTKGGVT